MQSSRERGREKDSEREKDMMENGGEREREREMPAYFWHRERRMPQMLDVNVWSADKALHKFESGCPRPGVWEVKSWQQDRC